MGHGEAGAMKMHIKDVTRSGERKRYMMRFVVIVCVSSSS